MSVAILALQKLYRAFTGRGLPEDYARRLVLEAKTDKS